LWEVGFVCDATNKHNPIVMLEDDSALIPRPGSMGSWPSLYQCLCKIVKATSGSQPALLLSQLKPLLQSHWHANIDEQWGYLDCKGASVKTKKMKHLIQSVLTWRNQRVSKRKTTQIDDALVDELELVPSNKHNDLLLRVVSSPSEMQSPTTVSIPHFKLPEVELAGQAWADVDDIVDCADEARDRCPSLASTCPYDDPFEPPPQNKVWAWDSTPSTVCSTHTGTMCSTPMHCMQQSDPTTPMSQHSGLPFIFMLGSMTSAGSSDIWSIPTGAVQHIRTRIENAGTAAPVAPASHWSWK